MEKEELAKKILRQIKVIRDSGRTNMFMDYTVKEIADEMGFTELINYMTENPNGYFGTILRGKVLRGSDLPTNYVFDFFARISPNLHIFRANKESIPTNCSTF